MESHFLRGISTFILISTLPKLGSSECVFGVNNTFQLLLRNQTIVGIMNDTLFSSTDAGDAAVSSVSDFELWKYLQVNNSIRPVSYLDFISKGKLLQINWTVATSGRRTNETSESRTLASYIITEIVVPLHSKLQALAVTYSFSLGIFRPFRTQYNFAGITVPSMFAQEPTLDLSCTAGSWFVWRVSTDYLHVPAFDNKNSTQFANLATAIEQTFDQYYRRHAVLNKDFVRANVRDIFSGVSNYTVLYLEVYFLNATFDSASVTKLTTLASIPIIYYVDPIKSTTVAVKLRTDAAYTHLLNITTTTSTSTTSTSAATTTTSPTIPSTLVSTPTDALTSSTILSTLTESSLVASTTIASHASTNTSDISFGTFVTTLSPNELTVNTQNMPVLVSNSTKQVELSTGAISNESTLVANFTALAENLMSSTLYLTSTTTDVSTTNSNNNTIITSPVAKDASTTVASLVLSTTLELSTISTIFADSMSNSTYSENSVTTRPFQIISGFTEGNSTNQNIVISNLSPNTSLTIDQNALSSDNVSFQTTVNPNVSLNNDTYSANNSDASAGTFNAISNSTSNGTGYESSNGTSNPYLTHSMKESTTFDPDPFFKPTAPVVKKIYNDHILLHQVGPMAPLTEKLAFLSITVPAALGISVVVIICILCLQLEWSNVKSAA